MINERSPLKNHDCYVPTIDFIRESCFSFEVILNLISLKNKDYESIFNFKNEYVLKYLYIIVNLCENGVSTQEIQKVVLTICMSWLLFF